MLRRYLGGPSGWRLVGATVVVAILVSLGLPGMRPSPALGQAVLDLEGTPWRLLEYSTPSGAHYPVLPNTEITATFASGRVAGSSGCNSYTGAYSVSGDLIAISGIAGTLAACPVPVVMEQERAYLIALQSAARFWVTSDALFLLDSGGAVLLTYIPQPRISLEGTAWRALDYNNGRGAVVSVMAGTEITAYFEGGQLSGSAGCNTYMAPYAVTGPTIEIGTVGSARSFCASPEGIVEQEIAYLGALPTAQIYRIEGDRLFLERADGARVASYTAIDGGAGTEAPQAGEPEVTRAWHPVQSR